MFNSYYKRYNFFNFCDCLFTFLAFASIFFFNFIGDYAYLGLFGIFGGISLACSVYSGIYFNKTYQFKKNAKKIIKINK